MHCKAYVFSKYFHTVTPRKIHQQEPRVGLGLICMHMFNIIFCLHAFELYSKLLINIERLVKREISKELCLPFAEIVRT